MSPTSRTQVTLDRTAFQQHFDVFWGCHDWPEDAVLTVTAEEVVGKKAKPSIHAPVHDADAVWDAIVKAGSDRKTWIGIAPRSMGELLVRIEKNLEWNRINGAEVRAFNKENAAAIEEGAVQRKMLKATDLKWLRGDKTECHAIPGFALDLDVDMDSSEHSEHKLDKPSEDGKAPKVFPSREAADRWLEECPLRYTLKIWTGGGYHVWFAAAKLMNPEEQEKALARFKAYWVGIKESSGMHIDVGTLETTRVMRPAGSLKGKGEDDVYFSPIETVDFNPEARFTAADLDLLPEYFNPRRERRIPNDDGTVSTKPISTRSQAEKDALPGTKLSHNLPVSVLLEDVLEFYRDGDKFTAKWDGDYEQDAVHAALYMAYDGAEVVKVYGERTSADLGLDGSAPYSSFGLLINYWCGGDAALAARIAAEFEDDVEGLVELLTTHPSAEELEEMFPRTVIIEDSFAPVAAPDLTPVTDDITPGSTVDVDQEIQDEINEALADVEIRMPTIKDAFAGTHEFEMTLPGSDNLSIRVLPGKIGLWERYMVKDATGKDVERFTRVTDWVAWRSEAVTPLRLTPEGKVMPAADPRFTVQLINDYGVFETHDMSAKDSVDSAAVLDKLNSGSILPVAVVHKKHMDNALRTLGRHDAQVLLDKFTSTGILNDAGKHVYLAPAGSISAEGITTHYKVDAPKSSEEGALRPSQAAFGFDRIAEGEELFKAAEAVQGYLNITPGRTDYGITTFGALPASVLPQSRYISVAVFAKPTSGKSWSLSSLQSFFSGVGVDGRSFSMTFSNKTTVFGAGLIAGWHVNSLGCYDDFRVSGISKEDDNRVGAFESIIQSSYGADGRAAGNGDGGLRGTSTASTMSVITGEGAPASSGEAIHSRYLKIDMGFGDFAITPKGSSPLDHFIERFAITGEARAFFASYIQWVMRQIDAAGSIAAFRAAVDKRKKGWESNTAGRAAEGASTVAVGWMYMHDWAAEYGITRFLPSMETISKALLAVAMNNAETTADIAPGRRILSKLSEMIVGGDGYVESHDLGRPAGNERLLGWEATGFQGEYAHGVRTLIGHLSEDRKWIHVTSSALGKVKTAVGLSGLGKQQTIVAMESIVRPGTNGGDRASTNLGLAKLARGYTISVEDLELDLVPVPELPARPAATMKREAPGSSVPAASAPVDDDDFDF